MAVTTSSSTQKRFRIEVVFLTLVSTVCGALAGGAAGLYASQTRIIITAPVQVIHSTTSTTPTTVTPTTTISLIPATRTPTTPLLPPAFLSRRSSSVAEIFRLPKGTALEDRLLTDDRLLGQAVALTSDGWLVTTSAALQSLHLADLVVWHQGHAFPVDRGMIDSLNGTAFLKITGDGFTPTAFAHSADIVGTEAVWQESRAGQFEPKIVKDVRYRRVPTEAVSSETATRRIVLSGTSAEGDAGGAVWDTDGALVGLLESGKDESTRVIPASSIASSFSMLLSNGVITHASLGVHAIDVVDFALAGSRGDLPTSGAWVHDDKQSGKPAVAVGSAAAKAKLKDGDVILEVERDILDGTADLGEVLADYRPGASVTIRVHRATGDVDVPVELGSVVTSSILK